MGTNTVATQEGGSEDPVREYGEVGEEKSPHHVTTSSLSPLSPHLPVSIGEHAIVQTGPSVGLLIGSPLRKVGPLGNVNCLKVLRSRLLHEAGLSQLHTRH